MWVREKLGGYYSALFFLSLSFSPFYFFPLKPIFFFPRVFGSAGTNRPGLTSGNLCVSASLRLKWGKMILTYFVKCSEICGRAPLCNFQTVHLVFTKVQWFSLRCLCVCFALAEGFHSPAAERRQTAVLVGDKPPPLCAFPENTSSISSFNRTFKSVF